MSTEKRSLVVVTCKRDQFKFEMLVRSLFAFVKPCKIIIIYNEQDNKYNEWLDWFQGIKPLLSNFYVKTFKASDFMDVNFEHTSGWLSQQYLKLFAFTEVMTEEFVVLDSKNFFIQHCSLDDIQHSTPHGNWRFPNLEEWVKEACKFYDIYYPGKHLKLRSTVTPYIMKTRVVRRMFKKWDNKNHFIDWFGTLAREEHISPSEFILYELYEAKTKQRDPSTGQIANYATLWGHHIANTKDPKILGAIVKEENIKRQVLVSGIHGGIDKFLSLEDVKNILKTLDCEHILPQTVSSPF